MRSAIIATRRREPRIRISGAPSNARFTRSAAAGTARMARWPARISDRRRSLGVALALASLCACTATVARPRAPTPTGAAPMTKQVTDVLLARDKALATFRAQARLDYTSPQQSFRSTQVVVVRAPASARIDVMNPFGVSYTVATDGKQISAYDRR